MIDLIKFELDKIFHKKSLYILAILIVLFIVPTQVMTYIELNKCIGSKNNIKTIAFQFEDGRYTIQQFQNDLKSIEKKKENHEELTKKQIFIDDYLQYT